MPNIIVKTFKNWGQFERKFKSLIPKECFLKENENNCWEWQGVKVSAGYGSISWGENVYGAHRISYLIFNGEVLKDQVVRHICDNPGCVNPKHLILGTQAANVLDCTKRERNQFSTKLNPEAVKVIKWMLKYKPEFGLINKLAKIYKVSHATISRIGAGKIWHWIEV